MKATNIGNEVVTVKKSKVSYTLPKGMRAEKGWKNAVNPNDRVEDIVGSKNKSRL